MKVLLGSLVFLALAAPSLMAQRAWKGGSGDWHDAANWTTGVPVTNTAAQFPHYEDDEAIVVSISSDAVTRSMQIGEGVDLTLRLGSDVSLTTSSSWRIGYGLEGTGSGPARLTVEGPATGTGWLNLTAGATDNQFFLNNGSALVLRGANLRVENAGPTAAGTLAASHNNSIELHDGVIFKTANFRLGYSTSTTGYSGGNSLKVRSGSTLQVTGNTGFIGSNIGHFNNYLSVTGANSKVEFIDQSLFVGDAAEKNHGGNYAEVADGGSMTTNAVIRIYAHDAAESEYGINRITIGAGGRITSSDTIEVGTATSTAGTLLQLEEGGELDGSATVNVNRLGVFEAAGNGLGAEVVVNITEDGTLAIGQSDATEPTTLSLKGTAQFDEGGFLRMGIYADGADELNLATGAELIGKITLLLDYEHVELGAIYTFFTGDIAGVTAQFDVSHLDAQLWDFSQFNAAGGWQLHAIPEPSSLALLAAGAAFAGWVGRRKARRQIVPLLAGATALLGGDILLAAEEVTVLEGEMEVERASDIRLSVALPEVTPDDEAVLEFTAWYPAPKHAGYYSAMRVYWGAQELEDILDRPTTFQTQQGKKEGRTSPIRRRKSWMVPVVPSPEDFNPKERSYVSPEQMNPFLFRFRLPATQSGEYELRITNSMKDDYNSKEGYQIFPILKVRDIVVRLEPKP